MRQLSRRITAVLRNDEAGFTLIELGIVIAVIAVLASVVLLGRGFISASRLSKAVDASATVKSAASTYAGVNGGTFSPGGTALTGNQMANLFARSLIPATTGWVVSTGFAMADVRVATLATGANQVLMTISTPAGSATDLFNNSLNDVNFITAATSIDTVACTIAAPAATATTLNLCFSL